MREHRVLRRFSRAPISGVDDNRMSLTEIRNPAPVRGCGATRHTTKYATLLGGALCMSLLAGCGGAKSAEASESASAAPPPPRPALHDPLWAIDARAQFLDAESGVAFGDPQIGDAPLRAWPVQWPFDGFVATPQAFTTTPTKRSVAQVEWRMRNGQLVESFVDGDPSIVALCLRHFPRATATRTDDWIWPAAYETAFSTANALHAANSRWLWCDALTDAYEIAPGGPYLLVSEATDGTITSTVAWMDGNGVERPSTHGGLTRATSCTYDRGAETILATADFDANGSTDILHLSGSPRGSSLGMLYTGVLALTDLARRTATLTEISCSGIGFVDLDQNGRAEMLLAHDALHVAKCNDQRPHDFIVTDLLGFQRMQVVDLAGLHHVQNGRFFAGFPAWRQIDGDPRDAFEARLSGNLKRELHTSGFPAYRRK